MKNGSNGAAGSVALLTMEGPASRVLANVLSSAGLLNLIVIESGPRGKRLRRTARRLVDCLPGAARARQAFRPPLPPERRVEIDSLAAAQRRVAAHHPASYLEWPAGVPRLAVDDHNGERCQDALRQQRPDVIAVFRTRILRKDTFNLARLGAVNCHYSLLPQYRGNFVEFWQSLNDDLQTAGVTFHFIDEGVDTGDIIAAVGHDDLPHDVTPFDLRYRNYMLMLHHFPGVLQDVLEGRSDRQPQPGHPSRAYRSGDLTDELRRGLYQRLGILAEAPLTGGRQR